MYKKLFKRSFDFVFAIVGLVFFAPLLIIISVILTFVNNGSPLFFQNRPGLNNKIFKVIKFKTMNDKTDENGLLLSDEKRLTRIGKIIRKTSLDELPQLINVISGNMSFVGPRPLLVEYLPLYNKTQKKRHNVLPGITGWAQINGRNAISWNEKFILDVWYVNNLSFMLDAKILFLTIIKVFKREGISAKNNLTMTKFKGN